MARLLDSEWDPLGVYAGGDGPIAGEYEPHAWEVLAHLRDGASASETAVVLAAIKAREMELGPGPEDAHAAQALVDWYLAADACR